MTPRSPSSSSAWLIRYAASRITLNVPIRLTWITRVKDSSGNGPSLPVVRAAVPMPAQLTTILGTPPARAPAASSALSTSAGQVTDDYRRTRLVQPDGRGQAQARRPAGDQGDASRDVHGHLRYSHELIL